MAEVEEGMESLNTSGGGNELDKLTADWQRIKNQKSRPTGGVEGRVLLNLCMEAGEQHVDYRNKGLYAIKPGDGQLSLVFNLIGPRFNKLVGRISSIDPPFHATADKTDPKATSEAEVVDKLIIALDQKLDQTSKTREIIWWMGVGGVAFEYTPWVPNAVMEPMPVEGPGGEFIYVNAVTGEEIPESQFAALQESGQPVEGWELKEEVVATGDVGSVILSPLQVFVDQSVKSLDDLAPDQMVYIAQIKTVEWVEENFGVKVDADKHLSIVGSTLHQDGEATGGRFLKDLIPLVQGSADANDPPMTVIVEGYGPTSLKRPRGRYVVFVPGKKIIHDGPNPYGEIPLTDFHWEPTTTTFWGGDYITNLIAPQRFINKRLSQLGEQANSTLYANLLLGPGLSKEDVPADYPGSIDNGLNDQGIAMIGRLAPPELPTWFVPSLDTVIKLFNDIAGGADLFQESRFPGQLRGPMAVPMLQEILDTEWGPLYRHIGERMARVKQQRLNRVKQFYPPIRTLHYTNRDQRDEVLEFHREILESGINYNITVERGELMPELRAMKEARLQERLAGPLSILYIDERTGALDKSKIAADLKFGDAARISREAQYHKLGAQIVEMLWEGRPVPPVYQFYDHRVMMDELEAAMATTEFMSASPATQQAFAQRWEEHRNYLMQEAQAQQQAMQGQQIQSAVAQATQMAAAKAAAEAVESTRDQMAAQDQVPTEELVRAANGKTGQAPRQAPRQTPKKRIIERIREEG